MFIDRYARGFISGAGVRFHYVKTGSGVPVILLHGFPESWFSWNKQLDDLAADASLYAFDLKGYGDSDKPLTGQHARYDVGSLSYELGHAIHALHLPPVILAGHDWGGILAYMIAVRFPQLVARLVLLNTSIRPFNPLRFWYGFAAQLPLLPDLFFDRFGDRIIRSCFVPPMTYHPEAYSEAEIAYHQAQFRLPHVHTCSLAYYRNIFQSLPLITAARKRGLRMPAEIIWGNSDPVLTVGLAESMAEELSAPLHLVEQTGHFVHSSNPSETNRILSNIIHQV